MMNFGWDDKKNADNLEKHGITFEEASLIFSGDVFSKIDDRQDYGEERIISIGTIKTLLVVVIVHTDRDGATRIISARYASRKERRSYNDYKKKRKD